MWWELKSITHKMHKTLWKYLTMKCASLSRRGKTDISSRPISVEISYPQSKIHEREKGETPTKKREDKKDGMLVITEDYGVNIIINGKETKKPGGNHQQEGKRVAKGCLRGVVGEPKKRLRTKRGAVSGHKEPEMGIDGGVGYSFGIFCEKKIEV